MANIVVYLDHHGKGYGVGSFTNGTARLRELSTSVKSAPLGLLLASCMNLVGQERNCQHRD